MRLPRHVAGFIVFIMILTCVEMVNDLFSGPLRAVRVKVAAPPPVAPPAAADEAPPVNYDVRLVSLDFINGKSYTTLVLNRKAGQPAPEMIEVVTDFYVPGDKKRRGWSSGTRIQGPFDSGDRVEVTAAAECDWCNSVDVPKAGYFADVYVRSLVPGRTYLPSLKPEPVVTAEVPVVVQADRRPGR